MSCFEKLLLLLISLLLMDVGVELLLVPKMSSSSSSSKKDEALAFFVVDFGLTFWKRSSLLSSKMDGNVLLSLSFFNVTPLLACCCEVFVVVLVEGVFVTEVVPNRLSGLKRSSSSGDGSTLVLLLSLFEPFFPALVDTGSVITEGLFEVSVNDG